MKTGLDVTDVFPDPKKVFEPIPNWNVPKHAKLIVLRSSWEDWGVYATNQKIYFFDYGYGSASYPANKFTMQDPFNPENRVHGYILRANEVYGDLFITHVNGEPALQYIHTTPKFYYPYRSKSMFTRDKFNKPVEDCLIYNKWDGSNIFTFEYHDADGNKFVSYKTRLSPFVRNNSFFNLYDLFMEAKGDCEFKPGVSLELYGYKAHILIKYDVPIALVKLFRLDKKGNIYPLLGTEGFIERIGPADPDTLERVYTEYEQRAEREYLENKSREGFMFYCKYADGHWEAYKCKSISAVRDNSDISSVSYEECLTTMLNTVTDDPIKETKQLLLEIYDPEVVNSPGTLSNLSKAFAYLTFRNKVFDTFKRECKGKTDVREIMRTMSKFFEKKQMSRVYTLLKQGGFINED